MKRILNVFVLVLALNFLAIAGVLGWLVQSKHLDRGKLLAIRDIVLPRPVEVPTTQPSNGDAPTTQPMMRLEELLARTAGRSASDQVEYIQHAFDAQMAQLDRRARELNDQQRQV